MQEKDCTELAHEVLVAYQCQYRGWSSGRMSSPTKYSKMTTYVGSAALAMSMFLLIAAIACASTANSEQDFLQDSAMTRWSLSLQHHRWQGLHGGIAAAVTGTGNIPGQA